MVLSRNKKGKQAHSERSSKGKKQIGLKQKEYWDFKKTGVYKKSVLSKSEKGT